jgi:RNA polymerase sigma-70 factor (ECF subfamily)
VGTNRTSTVDVFLAHAAAREALARIPALARFLDEAQQIARAAWPQLALPVDAFVAYLAERLPAEDAARALADLHVAELYLACGCARGEPTALRLFEERYLSQVRTYLPGEDRATIDEVQQRLRIRLFGGEADRPPQIGKYRGSGALGGWLRVAAVRIQRDLQRAQRYHLAIDDERDRLRADHPELELLKARHAKELNEVFAAVLRGLPAEERNILSLRFLDGLSTDAIAALLRLDGSTVRRRLTKLRERILDETRARLVERLRVNDSECDSLIALVRSQLGVSVARVLR